MDSRSLQQAGQIVHAEVPVRTSMAFTASRGMLCEDLLTRKGGVAAAPTDGISTNVAVRMADVVAVLLVEGVVCYESEGLAPEDQAVLHRQTEPFEEKGVLQAAKMFKMIIFAQGHVKVTHAERKVLG